MASGDMPGCRRCSASSSGCSLLTTGAVNWELARDLARQVVAQQPDRSADAGDRSRLADVGQLAEHWLDAATEFPAGTSQIVAVEPRRVGRGEHAGMAAAGRAGRRERRRRRWAPALPAEAQAMAGPMLGMLNQLGSAMFSQQIGQAIGELSEEVVSATDIGFPVGTAGTPADRADQRARPSARASGSTSPTSCSTSCCASARTSGCTRTPRGFATTCSR